MSTDNTEQVRQLALSHAKREFDFEYVCIVSIDDESHVELAPSGRFVVKMELTHSPEKIEALVSDGDPEEADIKRGFLQGAFKLKLVIAGDMVESTEWENMDIC